MAKSIQIYSLSLGPSFAQPIVGLVPAKVLANLVVDQNNGGQMVSCISSKCLPENHLFEKEDHLPNLHFFG